MTILHDIIDFYNTQPAGTTYRAATKILLSNLDKVENSSIEKLAEICCVSTATMNRLVGKLGCASFKDFRKEVAAIYNNYYLHNRCYPYKSDTKTQTPTAYFSYFHEMLSDLEAHFDSEQFDAICTDIHSRKSIYMFMSAPISPAKRQLQLDLTISGKLVDYFSEIKDPVLHTGSDPENIFLLCDQDALRTDFSKQIQFLEHVASAGVKIAAFVPDDTPYIQKFVNYPIYFRPTDTAMNRYLIDILVNLLTLRYRALYMD